MKTLQILFQKRQHLSWLNKEDWLGVLSDPTINPDVQSLRQILTYGIKGVAAYADHAEHS